MTEVVRLLESLVAETHKSEADILTLAMQAGLRQLWREHVLGRYLCEDLTREQAVEAVGEHWVQMAESEHDAMVEDLAWTLAD
jgi:hypothetical protein